MHTVKHKPGLQLQYLLQGGSYRNTKLHEITMIGAMPAVAVRHERRRQEKKVVSVNNLNAGDRESTSNTTTGNRRPSLLTLQSPHSQTGTPITSPPYVQNTLPDIYVCSKISVLHIAVVTILIGAILLIVGLVQLKPGADAYQYKFLLIFSGLITTLVGILMAIVQCCLLPWIIKRRQRSTTPSTPGLPLTA
ncbi:uncharacterized protein LOC126840235 isoform X2 [Adelges cooleyi]|uniref:uncharacterized protein LOC126840235 isoform X2 n=1 Tax=Adelges cooleyi TaxID=133065 RepID=UPI0021807466|nr:uncharacterized protein LOC126840235 isoform X2 [Adelges cooleyi]